MSRFLHREDGSVIPFSLMMLTLMLMMGGFALDLMRHEEKRTLLQQTLDRSVLAAASLQQSLDPESVLRDYFDKAGVSQFLRSVTVEEGLNFRSVQAYAVADTNPFFMHMVGVNEFLAAAGSKAEQRINNVEVSLVLDISGSMSGSRINALRPAAREFVDTLLASSDPGRVTISIIPYAGTVNLGQSMEAQFNVQEDHAYSYCVDLPTSSFGSISLSQTTAMTHTGSFDPYSSGSSAGLKFCPASANEVLALSRDATALKNKIDALQVGGNTSIDIGMKWGALLLDPNAQPVISGMISAGDVSSEFQGRPLDRNNNDVLKIVVIMTDGQNTTQYQLNPDYRSGDSDVWKRNGSGAGRLSLYDSRISKYWWQSDSSWHSGPDGGSSGSTRMTYPDMWHQFSLRYIARYVYSAALNNGSGSGTNTYYNYFVSSEYASKDSRLNEICNAAKAKQITVFGIGFEAPSSGQAVMQACSTSSAHYYNASTIDITTAFRSIASQISHLRLTQ